MNWQSIDTAPKDGTRVLVFRPAREQLGSYERRHVGVHTDHFDGGAWQMSPRYVQPTHWMPLPTAPQDAERNGAAT